MRLGLESARGFTLIEMSIVLVIIGLIVGGVLVGQDLIRAAGIRKIVSEKDQMAAAINTFFGKYDYLPGDFPNGDSTFGVSNTNGDGNGQIDDACSAAVKAAPYNAWPYKAEEYSMWVHLAKAGMLWGNYAGPPTGSIALGVQYPASKYGYDLGYVFMNNVPACELAPAWSYGQTWTNAFVVNGGYFSGDASSLIPALTPMEAQSIDAKIDDGMPASGVVETLGDGSGNGTSPWWVPGNVPSYACAKTNSASTAAYDLTVTTRTCLMFWFNMLPQ